MKVVVTVRNRDGSFVDREIEKVSDTAEERKNILECFKDALHHGDFDVMIVRIERGKNG